MKVYKTPQEKRILEEAFQENPCFFTQIETLLSKLPRLDAQQIYNWWSYRKGKARDQAKKLQSSGSRTSASFPLPLASCGSGRNLPAADRQVSHGYTTTEVPPTTYKDNHSQSQIQFHHCPPFLHHQQQKQTSTVSSSSPVHGAVNSHNIIDGGQLNLNHVPNNNRGYDDQVMNYGSAINARNGGYSQIVNYGSADTNVNNGGLHQLINSSHDYQQPYVLIPPSKQKQQHGNCTYNGSGYNPSAGSGVRDNGAAGFYSPKVVDLSTQKKQHYHDHLSQHSDHISPDKQKNLNNGEDIGFTRYSKSTNINAQITDSKSTDFLELDLERKWSNNNVYDGHIKKDSKAAELLAVYRKGKSSAFSSSSAADRQVYHGYPTATAASVLPTTTYNQSQSQIQSHHYPPFLHHQQQKQTTSTVSSSVDDHRLNTHIIDYSLLDLNHDINNNGSYDQVIMNYGSAATNDNGGLHQLMNSSHDYQQPYVPLPPSMQQQQHGNSTYNGASNNPTSVGSGFRDQHGNNNGAAAGFYSLKVVELSSTQKEQYHLSPQQHSDRIPLNIQKNLNNGENIGGFTRYSKPNTSADFLEPDLGPKWNNNDNVDGHIKKDSKLAAAGLLRSGYSGLTNDDQVELLAVHRKGKLLSSSSILMEYDFLSSSMIGHDQYQHTRGGGSKKDYSSNYSSPSCIMEDQSAASSSAVRKGGDFIISSSSSQSNSDHHDLSLKLSSYH